MTRFTRLDSPLDSIRSAIALLTGKAAEPQPASNATTLAELRSAKAQLAEQRAKISRFVEMTAELRAANALQGKRLTELTTEREKKEVVANFRNATGNDNLAMLAAEIELPSQSSNLTSRNVSLATKARLIRATCSGAIGRFAASLRLPK